MPDHRVQTTKKRGVTPYGQGLVLYLLVLSGALLAADSKRSEKTFEATPNPRITLTNMTGQILVRGWDKAQVHVVYSVVSPHVEVDTEVIPPNQPADKIHFATHLLDPLVSGKDQTVDYSLDVPMGTNLEIRNPQGSVRIEKSQGDDASVESVGGAILVSDFTGHLFLRSVGGNIEVIRPSGRVEAYSITGDLHFVSPTTSKLRASTTSGRILFEGDFPDGGDYSLSAYSGDMDILCPPSASFELNAKTVRGKLEDEMPMTIRHRPATPVSSANSLFGTHLTGKATVNLNSFSGTIRIRQR
ncbi:MAG: DUF4097 family beta strand repeat-containing protein [Terriglobia bacterium]